MANQTNVRDFGKMMIRLPPGMRERIASAANTSGRSMNAEVIARLEASFNNDEAAKRVADLVEEHENVVGEHERRLDEIERDVTRLLDQAGLLIDYR